MNKTIAAIMAVFAFASFTTFGSVQPANAQAAPPVVSGPAYPAAAPTPPAKRHNLIQRHPTGTGVVAGMATHHALKVSAARKKRNHQRLSWAERHPTLTGIGAGLATRHVIKKNTH
jgi:hypothetical protein